MYGRRTNFADPGTDYDGSDFGPDAGPGADGPAVRPERRNGLSRTRSGFGRYLLGCVRGPGRVPAGCSGDGATASSVAGRQYLVTVPGITTDYVCLGCGWEFRDESGHWCAS